MWKEYDDDTVVNNSTQPIISYRQTLPDSTKQKAFEALNSSEENVKKIIISVFCGWITLMFGSQAIVGIVRIIRMVINGSYKAGGNSIAEFVMTAVIVIVDLICLYFLCYKFLWKKVGMQRNNTLRDFRADNYEILMESTVLDKRTSSYNRSTSRYVQVANGETYNPLFVSQYELMHLGDEVYVLKINNQLGVILK